MCLMAPPPAVFPPLRLIHRLRARPLRLALNRHAGRVSRQTTARDAVRAVHRGGGITTTQSVIDAGVTVHAIRTAIAAGELVRIRRKWLAAQDADPDLVTAARAGVVLSCATQARRIGLWVQDTSDVHVAAPPRAGHVRAGGAIVHWSAPIVPRPREALIDPVENVLSLVSTCLPFAQALAIWESALRKDLVSLQSLRAMPFGPRGRRLIAVARPWSDSGLESIATSRLRFLRLPITQQAFVLGKPVDVLIGDRLILEIDGATHTGRQRDRDIAFDARAAANGYHVIRVSYVQVLEQWPMVQRMIMTAVAQGRHLAA